MAKIFARRQVKPNHRFVASAFRPRRLQNKINWDSDGASKEDNTTVCPLVQSRSRLTTLSVLDQSMGIDLISSTVI